MPHETQLNQSSDAIHFFVRIGDEPILSRTLDEFGIKDESLQIVCTLQRDYIDL